MIRFIYILLALLVLGCVQQVNTTHPKDDVAPIDTSLAVTAVPIDSTLAATTDRQEETMLPDSAKITLTASQIGAETVVFSINHDKGSTIELSPGRATMTGKIILSRAYSDQILKRIGVIFLEHKAPIIFDKKYIPEEFAFFELPIIKFVIYSSGKTIETEYFFVGERQGHYEITYSTYFLILYDMLYTKAMALYELTR